jgi:hypothetical protein
MKTTIAQSAVFVMYDDPEWMYARIDQFLQ